jgi:hypothetical protein
MPITFQQTCLQFLEFGLWRWSSRSLEGSLMGATHMANIAVVLVEPQIPENIGAAARTMNNMGFRLYDHLNFHTNYHKPFDLK